MQANPSLTPAGIETALKDSAIDMDNPFTVGFDVGDDDATGAGFVDALGALGEAIDTPQLENLDPNEYILVNVNGDLLDANSSPSIIDVDLVAPGADLTAGGDYQRQRGRKYPKDDTRPEKQLQSNCATASIIPAPAISTLPSTLPLSARVPAPR